MMETPTHLFNREYTVTRNTRTSNGMGGYTENLVEVGTVLGRDWTPTANDFAASGVTRAEMNVVVVAGPDEDLRRDDVLVEGGRSIELRQPMDPSERVYQKWGARMLEAGD